MKEYVNCQHCINKRCARYGGPYGYTFCDSYIQDTPKEKTNADRIRAMSDEELAKFIPNWSYTDACKCGEHYVDCNNECEKCVADWLQQPAEEDNHA